MGNLWQDVRYGARMLLKSPGFTSIAVLALALGIGANTAIFSVVNGVLLRPLAYKDPDRLVMLWEANNSNQTIFISNPTLLDWREQSTSFESFSGYTGRFGGPATITGGNEPERAYATAVYRDFFTVLGVSAQVGRTFTPEDHQLDAAPAVVVSYRFWQRRLGGDPNLSNKKIRVEGENYFDVVGVMPPGFNFPTETDVWLPKEQLFNDTSSRTAHNYAGIARLKPSVSIEQAQTEMKAIASRLEEQYPAASAGMSANVISLEEQLVGAIRPALLILLAAVGFVLLIACANVANLLLARSLGREREIAIRSALGASRFRIVRQLLTESALLSTLGGVLGLIFAFWLIDLLVALSSDTIPRINEVRIDRLTLLFTLSVSLFTSLLFGLMPAMRLSKPDLQEALKEGGQRSGGRSGRMRALLVVAEVAMTMVLLIGAGLLIKSFWRLMQVNPGFNPDQVLTMQVSLPSPEYKEDYQVVAFYRQVLERIKAVPGVQTAGAITNLPLGGVDINGGFLIEGRSADSMSYAGFRVVSPEYFRTFGIPLVKGRLLTEGDREDSLPVALISQTLAERAWPNEDPTGKRIKSGMDDKGEVWVTIVGVVGDVRHRGLERSSSADLYLPFAQRPRRAGDMTVVARVTGDPASFIPAVREQVRIIDQSLPVAFEPMERVFARSVANRQYNMLLLGIFAAVALLLSTIGIYGVISYSVTQRTHEIGIRIALGAQESDVLKMVVGQGMALTLIGVGLGLAGAFALTRIMSSLLFRVSASDPLTFITVSVLLAVVALAACYLPARRAMKVDPLIALRYE